MSVLHLPNYVDINTVYVPISHAAVLENMSTSGMYQRIRRKPNEYKTRDEIGGHGREVALASLSEAARRAYFGLAPTRTFEEGARQRERLYMILERLRMRIATFDHVLGISPELGFAIRTAVTPMGEILEGKLFKALSINPKWFHGDNGAPMILPPKQPEKAGKIFGNRTGTTTQVTQPVTRD